MPPQRQMTVKKGPEEVPLEIQQRISPSWIRKQQRYSAWKIIAIAVLSSLAVTIFDGGELFCPGDRNHGHPVLLCAAILTALQLALGSFLILGSFIAHKKHLALRRGMGSIACAFCGYPYDLSERPVRCPECGARLDGPNTLQDYRFLHSETPKRVQKIKRENRFLSSPWYVMLVLLLVLVVFAIGWYNFYYGIALPSQSASSPPSP